MLGYPWKRIKFNLVVSCFELINYLLDFKGVRLPSLTSAHIQRIATFVVARYKQAAQLKRNLYSSKDEKIKILFDIFLVKP